MTDRNFSFMYLCIDIRVLKAIIQYLWQDLKTSPTVKNRKLYFVAKSLRKHRIICFNYILIAIYITAHTKRLQPRLGLQYIMYLSKHKHTTLSVYIIRFPYA